MTDELEKLNYPCKGWYLQFKFMRLICMMNCASSDKCKHHFISLKITQASKSLLIFAFTLSIYFLTPNFIMFLSVAVASLPMFLLWVDYLRSRTKVKRALKKLEQKGT